MFRRLLGAGATAVVLVALVLAVAAGRSTRDSGTAAVSTDAVESIAVCSDFAPGVPVPRVSVPSRPDQSRGSDGRRVIHALLINGLL